MKDHGLLVEKYRPTNLDNYVGNESIKKSISNYIGQNDIQNLIFYGPAGTGKTYLAVAMALSMLLTKKVQKIILTRPAVEAGEKLGFLPGDLVEKVDPYLRPLYDALHDMLDSEKVAQMIETSLISGHFSELWNNAYLNIFSCKPFDAQVARDFAKEFFSAKSVEARLMVR